MRTDALRWPALAVVLLLTACAGGIRQGDDDRHRWQLSGKVGLRAEQLAESALLDWRQCGSHFDIRLAGPLGQTGAHIAGRGEQLVVQVRDREPVVTRDPAALLHQEFGWSVPLRALRHWVRAEAAPGGEHRFTPSTTPGRPATLEQFGWRIDYQSWHQRDELLLPARLVLTGPDLRATLLIREWQLGHAVTGCPAP